MRIEEFFWKKLLEKLSVNFLGPLMKVHLPLMKNELIPLAKNVLITLELTEAVSARDTAIHKNMGRRQLHW